MKLLSKTILYFILASIPLLIFAGIMSYRLITNAVNDNINEHLWDGKQRAQQIIDGFDHPQSLFLDYDSLSTIKPDSSGRSGIKLSEIIKMDAKEGEMVQYRMLKSYYKRKGQNYLITIIKPTMEEEDLLANLLVCLFFTIGLVVTGLFTVNWFLSKRIWKPFHQIIDRLNAYDVRKHSSEIFPDSKTKEFQQLALALNTMTEKIQRDFIAQKEFSENASHEMQTPLAIIKGKIDLLLQSNKLEKRDMENLEAIENAANRLSSLNRALLLLAKIENGQFAHEEELDVAKILEKSLSFFSELTEAGKIKIEKNIQALSVKMNASLCEIMINNLLVNAIRHNKEGGILRIDIDVNSLTIANSGEKSLDEKRLYERFKRNDSTVEGTGLGLAIVKSISDIYHFNITYTFHNNFHIFKITF